MTKYEELVEALQRWNLAARKHEEDSITTIGKFSRGLAEYLEIDEKASLFWLPEPSERFDPKQVVFIAGSRYVTSRNGYGFTLGLRISGSPALPFKIPLEFYRPSLTATSYAVRVFDRDFEFSEVNPELWKDAYEFIVERIKKNFDPAKLLTPKE